MIMLIDMMIWDKFTAILSLGNLINFLLMK